ncbi:MAG: hypothetical protein U1E65_34760 [Myxococcota bacterium]
MSIISARRTSILSASVLAFAAAVFAVGCGGGDSGADAGVGRDAFEPVDLGIVVDTDAGFIDAQPRVDAGPRDAGHYCVENMHIPAGNMSVAVASTTITPTNPQDNRSSMTCIGVRPNLNIGAPVRFRGCASFIGSTPTQAQLDELQIAVFPAQLNGQPVDPTYDPRTGADRTPAARIHPSIHKAFSGNCEHGVEIEIGRDSVGQNGLVTDVAYTLRVSSSSVAGNTWMDAYHFNVTVRSDGLENGSAGTDRCTPQTCSGRVNLILVKKAGFVDLAAHAGLNNLGSLDDHSGPGHAIIQANDCLDIPMRSALAGFNPVPAETNYLTGGLTISSPRATATSTSGALVGFGFAETSSVTPVSVGMAVALSRDGACTEAFGSVVVPVYSDAISFVRSGRETTLTH